VATLIVELRALGFSPHRLIKESETFHEVFLGGSKRGLKSGIKLFMTKHQELKKRMLLNENSKLYPK
jgi:hypothetical protein